MHRAAIAMLLVGLSGFFEPRLGAQSAAFEVASVKPSDLYDGRGIDFRFYAKRFVATKLTLEQLISQAYNIQAREVVGGPDWIRTDRFDAEATTEKETSREQMRVMLQSVLADRFKLQIVRETQPGTIYTLIAEKPKNLKQLAEPAGRSAIYLVRNDSNGYLSYTYDAHNTTIAALAQSLSSQLRAPVIDQTSIAGNFDFQVRYA